jgi:N-carbamoyl-L-amino-acid hydrolase
MKFNVDQERVCSELETLAAFSGVSKPGVTRIVFSQSDMEARTWFKLLCLGAGLEVREDAVGNTFATWRGSEPQLPRIGTGSHIDAIPHSGKYDGTVGVLGGLEAIRVLKASGFRPRRSIELLLFTSEEPTRFGIGCLGSRLLAGVLDTEAADRFDDTGGKPLAKIREQAGFSGTLDSVKLPPGYYHGFIELHIEQGPLLERDGIQLGIVTNIAAPSSFRLTIEGEGGHAGAVLMPQRRDAFLAAAEIALAVESAARATGAIDTVATSGVCEVFPGVINGIPSRVKLEFDIRDTDTQRRATVVKALETACDQMRQKRGTAIQMHTLNSDAPATCDPALIDVLKRASEDEGCSHSLMVSRAYHDSLFISRIAPVCMLFIPCKAGVSHRPDEYASPQDIANGVRVLARALAQLS